MKLRSMRIGFLVAVAAMWLTPAARANFQVALQEDAGPITLVAAGGDFTPQSFTGTFGDFNVTLLGGSSNNASALSDLLSSDTSVMNTAAAAHTLRLFVSQNDYTLPLGTQLSVESGLGGTVNIGILTPGGIFQAFADKGNNPLFPTNVIGSTIPSAGAATMDFTNGPQNDSQVGNTFDTGSIVGIFGRTGMYSMTSVAKLTLSAGGDANYSDHVNATAVPEPMALALMVIGLPLALSLRARRHQS